MFRTKEILKQNPRERQFEFSENYIFGKFDTFCKRLEKLAYMISTMKIMAGLKNVKIEGIDSLFMKYVCLWLHNAIIFWFGFIYGVFDCFEHVKRMV